MDFAYRAELELHDGSVKKIEIDEHGWAPKEVLEQIKVFTLVPKDPEAGWPLLRIHLPAKSKLIWLWRSFNDTDGMSMRIYAIGYKKRGQLPFYMWVVPGGHVEAGVFEPRFADTIWSNRHSLDHSEELHSEI